MGDDKILSKNSEDDFSEDYDEEEDEDFDPNNLNKESSGEEDDNDNNENDQELNKDTLKAYSHIESEHGGLIKTRKGRLLEDAMNKKRKYESIQAEAVTDNVKNIWEELKDTSIKRLGEKKGKTSVLRDDAENDIDNFNEETIWIERSYKFANELVHEKKEVFKSSAEAQEYINNLKFQEKNKNEKSPNVTANDESNNNSKANKGSTIDNMVRINLRRPLKRPSILEQIISGSLKPNLTTLEKSKLDWATYVDKEGINDELSTHNKDGYLAKQDFLGRVESAKDQQYKDMRQKQLAMQFQEQS